MKKLTILFVLVTQLASAQDWVKMMNDRNTNFYSTQKAFNNYYKQQARQQNVWYKKLLHVFNKESEKEIPGYEVYKRWENFVEPRVYPSGRMFAPDQAWNEFYNYCKKHDINSTNVSGNWTALGPTSWLSNSYNPGIGRVNVVFVDPNNPLTIYIGAPSGGLWKSTDGGSSWSSTTDQLPTIGVSGIAVPTGNSNTVYIGTGDGDGGDSYGAGVLKSFDGGLTWNTTGLNWALLQAPRITKLVISPADTSVLFATTNNGIFKTIDAGVNWTLVHTGSYRDIEFNTGNSNIIYASGTDFIRSTDGGNTFTQITSGLPLQSDVNHLAIGVTVADSNYIYVAAGASVGSGFEGLYKSTDGGLTFTQQSNSPNLYGYDMNGNDAGGQSWYSMTIAVAPDDRDLVYTGGVNIWRSFDGGVTWNIITHWVYDLQGPYPYVHADQHAMDFYGDLLYVGSDGGVFVSDDFGDSFNDLSAGVEISQFYRLGASSTDPTKIMAGAQDNGCNLYDNGQWTHVLGADGMETAIDPVISSRIYACGQGGWLNRSDNGGLTMNTISTGAMGGGNWITPYMLDPNNHNAIYAGYADLWKSTDYGNNWNVISNFGSPNGINTFNIAPSNSNYIFVVVSNFLFRTTDGGNSWLDISAGLPTGVASISSIAIHPTDSNRLWITMYGLATGNKVFYSDDAGNSWTNVSGNLLNVSANTIVYQNNGLDGLYVGTDVGVFYTDSTLSNWQPFWNGLPHVVIDELEINYVSNKIRAATYGRGLWESDLYVPIQAPPTANFTSDMTQICPGESIQFADASINAAPGWTWSFPGGVPSSSTLANPLITYPVSGLFTVQLTVSNAYGIDSVIQTSYVHVSFPVVQSIPFVEGFESIFPATNWKVVNPDGDYTWIQNYSVGGYALSAASTSINNYSYNQPGQTDVLLTSSYDLTLLPNPELQFDWAYSVFPGYADTLKIYYTNDCGLTRHYIFNKGGDSLATVPAISAFYVPAASDWKTYTISLDSNATTMNNAQFGFENINGYGNMLYLDNINIHQPVGIDEIGNSNNVVVFPNPFSSQITIQIPDKLNSGNVEVSLINFVGEEMKSSVIVKGNQQQLDASTLSSGIYLLMIHVDGKTYSQKLVKL